MASPHSPNRYSHSAVSPTDTKQKGGGGVLSRKLEVTCAVAFLWIGVAYAWASTDVTRFPDSTGYVPSEGFPLSFLGESLRPWLTPLTYTLLSTDNLRVAFQFLLYGLAWTLLLILLSRSQSVFRRRLSSLVALSAALSPVFFIWNAAILSEAITSACVTIGSLLALVLMRSDPSVRRVDAFKALAAVVGLFLVFAASMERQSLFPIALAVLVLVLIAFLGRGWKRVSALTALAFVCFGAYSVALNYNIDRNWGVSKGATFYLYLTATESRSQSVLADPLFVYVSQRGPECLSLIRASWDPTQGSDPFQTRHLLRDECPEGADWLRDNFFPQTYLRYVATHPHYTSRYLLTYLPDVAAPYWPSRAATLIPSSAVSLHQEVDTTTIFKSSPAFAWYVLALMAWVVVLSSAVKDFWRTKTLVEVRGEQLWLIALVPASVLATTLSILPLTNDHARLAAPAYAMTTIAVIVFLGRAKAMQRRVNESKSHRRA